MISKMRPKATAWNVLSPLDTMVATIARGRLERSSLEVKTKRCFHVALVSDSSPDSFFEDLRRLFTRDKVICLALRAFSGSQLMMAGVVVLWFV